ncbi:MAG: phytanoyl-CoA dioxygenase family protein [Alphaproteobacteria bacterium]
MPRRLTEAQVAAFGHDGFVAPITVMTAAEARGFRDRLEAVERERGPMHYVVKPHLVMTAADELAHWPPLLDAVEDLLGPDIMVWDAAFIIKEPGAGAFVSWHQDLTYWGLDSVDRVVSVWLALSAATAANGTMRMIPGSHRGRRDHRATADPNNILSRGQTVAVGHQDESRAVDIVLEPGQMSLHHGLVLHASGANRTADRRIGFNMNLIAPSVRQAEVADDTAMLVRGRDRFGHFRAEPRPAIDFDPAGCAFQADIARRRGTSVNADPAGRLVNPASRAGLGTSGAGRLA